MDDVKAINEVYAKRPRRHPLTLVATASDPETRRNLFTDSPAPWRAVNSFSELAAILDANGRTLGIVERATAGRIVAAVNMVECGHRKDGL